MRTLVNVARFHLVDRMQYIVMPIATAAFAFAVNAVVAGVLSAPDGEHYAGGLLALYGFMFVLGSLSVTKSLPFGLTLGLSRRSYYLGTIGLIVALGALYSLGIIALQGIERLSGGWGIAMHFFRVPWILDGPWYLSWLTSFVVMVLIFVYGLRFGLVYRRWGLPGTTVFIAAQVIVLLGASLFVTAIDAWPSIREFLTTLSAAGLTGVLAALAAALAAGGFTTMRRVTV